MPMAGCMPEDAPELPATLKIGVLPDEADEALRVRYGPLIAHLSRELGMPVQLVIPEDYADLVRLFGAAEVDLAYFGGVTFVVAQAEHQAVPLVMRNLDLEFSSYFLARADDLGAAVGQFGGRAFAFGSNLSTSGHLMPRFFLMDLGITPEHFFSSVSYSGAHDRTVAWVRDGVVDLGVANAEVVDAMLRDGRLKSGALRVVWETPPYADYVWAHRPGLDPAFTRQLRDAFLGLSPADDEDAATLERVGAGGFLPANIDDFAQLRDVWRALPEFPGPAPAAPN